MCHASNTELSIARIVCVFVYRNCIAQMYRIVSHCIAFSECGPPGGWRVPTPKGPPPVETSGPGDGGRRVPTPSRPPPVETRGPGDDTEHLATTAKYKSTVADISTGSKASRAVGPRMDSHGPKARPQAASPPLGNRSTAFSACPWHENTKPAKPPEPRRSTTQVIHQPKTPEIPRRQPKTPPAFEKKIAWVQSINDLWECKHCRQLSRKIDEMSCHYCGQLCGFPWRLLLSCNARDRIRHAHMRAQVLKYNMFCG